MMMKVKDEDEWYSQHTCAKALRAHQQRRQNTTDNRISAPNENRKSSAARRK